MTQHVRYEALRDIPASEFAFVVEDEFDGIALFTGDVVIGGEIDYGARMIEIDVPGWGYAYAWLGDLRRIPIWEW